MPEILDQDRQLAMVALRDACISRMHMLADANELPTGGKYAGIKILDAEAGEFGYKRTPSIELPYVRPERPLSSQTMALIGRFLADNPGVNILVRSNSICESGRLRRVENGRLVRASFRGRYRSMVAYSPTIESVADKVLKVAASIDDERALNYRERKSIAFDAMKPVLDVYIPFDYVGVLSTSNQSDPNCLSIEFSRIWSDIGEDSPYVLDYSKKSGKVVFRSKLASIMPEYLEKQVQCLFRIGASMEERHGPLYLEFGFKDEEIYLTQREEIDVFPPKKVRLQKSTDRELIATSLRAKGEGVFTLPVLVLPQFTENPHLRLNALFLKREGQHSYLDIATNSFRKIYEYLKIFDEMYSDGYVLLLEKYTETEWCGKNTITGLNKYLEDLTRGTRVILSIGSVAFKSHEAAIALERGIGFVGFEDSPEFLQKLRTGDLITVHFKGRRALIYDEKRRLVRVSLLREVFPKQITSVKKDEDGRLEIFSRMQDPNYDEIHDAIAVFFASVEGGEWVREDSKFMGGRFYNKNTGDSIWVSAYAFRGQSVTYTIGNPEWTRDPETQAQGIKYLSGDRERQIIDKMAEHFGL